MIRKICRYIKENNILKQGDRVLVGVSGGADSVCLLLCLLELREEYDLDLNVVHVHHGLRGEDADRDAGFVEELCKKVNVPFSLRYVDVRALALGEGLSTEEAGRRLRYQVFREEADGGKIAVAHHRDDQSETLLLNLFRGTGLKGLASMAPVKGDVIRPLLGVTRAEIEEYLAVHGQEYCMDATNQENIYTRNKIRNQLIPFVEAEINERAGEHLAKLADQAREVDEYLDRVAGEWICRYSVVGEINQSAAISVDSHSDVRPQKEIRLPVDALMKLDPAVGKRVLLLAPEKIRATRRDIGYVHICGMWELVDKQVGSALDLPGGLEVEREYDHLRIGYPCAEDSPAELPVMHTRVFAWEKEQKIPEKRYTKWFDYDKIKCNAVLRFRETGDYLELAGVGRKTVKSYMIDRKIPAGERDRIPVLADGGHVIWIVGYRINENYKVTEDTKRVLEVIIEMGPEGTQEEE